MSRTKPTEVELAQLGLPCPKCQAPAYSWCKPVWSYTSKYIEFELVATRPTQRDLHIDRFRAATDVGLLPLEVVGCNGFL